MGATAGGRTAVSQQAARYGPPRIAAALVKMLSLDSSVAPVAASTARAICGQQNFLEMTDPTSA
jgi:hypothetical protein